MSFIEEPDNGHSIMPTEEDTPFREYMIHLNSGENKLAKGFLAIAQTFLAVGTGAGEFNFIVPLSELSYAEEVPPAQGNA